MLAFFTYVRPTPAPTHSPPASRGRASVRRSVPYVSLTFPKLQVGRSAAQRSAAKARSSDPSSRTTKPWSRARAHARRPVRRMRDRRCSCLHDPSFPTRQERAAHDVRTSPPPPARGRIWGGDCLARRWRHEEMRDIVRIPSWLAQTRIHSEHFDLGPLRGGD